jgi:hypothetical protein
MTTISSENSNRLLAHRLRWSTAVLLILIVGFTISPAKAQVRGPLSETEVLDMLRSSEPSFLKEFAIRIRAKHYGIGFPLTQSIEKDLKAAGASDGLLQILRTLAPKPVQAFRPEPLIAGTYKLNSVRFSLQQDDPDWQGKMELTKISDKVFRFNIRLSRGVVLEYQGEFKLTDTDWNATFESVTTEGTNDPDYKRVPDLCYADVRGAREVEVVFDTQFTDWILLPEPGTN